VIVGIVVFWGLTFKYGEADFDNTKLWGVKPGIIGEKIGIKEGDKIIAVNGNTAHLFMKDLMTSEVLMGDAVLTIDRQGEKIDITLPAVNVKGVPPLRMSKFISFPLLLATSC